MKAVSMMLALAATAVAGPAIARGVPEAVPVGKAQNCVEIIQILESRVRNDQVIDFYLRNGQVMRNTLPNSCPQLGFEEAFSYKTSLSRLCNVDIITVLNRVGGGIQRGASCGLGMFQPVKIAKKAK